jgi:putative tryptophan/tyrosine transport system substrate-binding protein
MRRREFLVALGGSSLLPLAAGAQPHAAMPRVVMYSPTEPMGSMREDGANRYIRTLFAEMRRLGLIEGRTIKIERYGLETRDVSSKATISAIVESKPDLIFVVGVGALFKRATSTIPIVTFSVDPIREGLIKSLAHPGGNITGVAFNPETPIHGKRIALLREMFPALQKLAFLGTREVLDGELSEVREAADAQGIRSTSCLIDVPTSQAIYRNAIAKAKDEGANGVMVALDGPPFVDHVVVANQIAAAGLPAIYPFAEFVVAGGLMSYATDLVELNKRMASDMQVILSGTNPGDVPFYQATKFELFINLKAARALSLNVPTTLLAAADEVIE